MEVLTISEALAELKILGDRLAMNAKFVLDHVARDERQRDPFEREQSTAAAQIAQRMDSSRDLRARAVALRRAIALKNFEVRVEIEGVTRSVGEWLIWRREIAKGYGAELAALVGHIERLQSTVAQQNLRMRTDNTGSSGEPVRLALMLGLAELQTLREQHQSTLGVLDGRLRVVNATTTIEV